jgi:hypothetical protein
MPIRSPVFSSLGPSTLTESPRLGLCAVRIGETTPKRELLMLLYEANLMGRPVISVQPNRLRKSDVVDSRTGIEIATDIEQTLVAFRRALGLNGGERLRGGTVDTTTRNATDSLLSYVLDRSGLRE